VPTQIERIFADAGQSVEVFNFGMPDGYPGTYALLLDDALSAGFAAETIVVGTFVGNDFYDLRPRSADVVEIALDMREIEDPVDL
jgi:hypothetical protein